MCIERDIAEILGVTPQDGDDFTEEQRDEMLRLHRETFQALQIILVTGQTEPGQYVATKNQVGFVRNPMNWRRE